MTPEENVAFIKSLQARVAEAAAPVANNMADTFDRQVRFELTRVSHPPDMFWKAPPGRPPALATGHLVLSQITMPASGLIRASAMVGNTAVYAAIQEFGGETWPNHSRYMHWVNTGGSFFRSTVHVPSHPYFQPALDRVILGGSLQAHAMETFEEYMSPLIA